MKLVIKSLKKVRNREVCEKIDDGGMDFGRPCYVRFDSFLELLPAILGLDDFHPKSCARVKWHVPVVFDEKNITSSEVLERDTRGSPRVVGRDEWQTLECRVSNINFGDGIKEVPQFSKP